MQPYSFREKLDSQANQLLRHYAALLLLATVVVS